MKRILVSLVFSLAATAALAKVEVTELNRVVAVVNDDVITSVELAERTRSIVRQLEKQGTALPPQGLLARQVLERLIIERIQLKLAADAGIRVEEEAINQVINNIAAENRLTFDQFRKVLQEDGIAFSDYRDSIRDEMMIARLRARQVQNRVTVSPQEVDNYLESANARALIGIEYRLSHILIALPEAPTPSQLQEARAEAEKVLAELRLGADFRQMAIAHSDSQQALEGGDLGWRKGGQLPSLFAEAVGGMKEGDLSPIIRSPSGFHILRLAGVRGEEKHLIHQIHARHILISPNEITSEFDAKTRLARLRERIVAGENFADLARANSDDKGSASNGGDLGWASPGQMVPEFEQAMKETPLGTVSEPFRTQYGWHIVQPLERRDYDNTEEYRRSRAQEALRQRKIEEETENWLRQIRDEAYVEYKAE